MLSLTCDLVRRARPSSGGTRYDLKPISQQMVGTEVSSLDLELVNISVHDHDASQSILTLFSRKPDDHVGPEKSAASITIEPLGHLRIGLYLSQTANQTLIDDLNAATLNHNLKVAIYLDGEFSPSDQFVVKEWLAGKRFDETHMVWSNRACQVDLVIPRP